MNRSLSVTPSISYVLDRVLTGPAAPAQGERSRMPRRQLGVDLLGLVLLFVMLTAYVIAA